MGNEEKKDKYDLKETLEAFDATDGVLDDLAAHKSDDGRIDLMEAVQTLATNAPAMIKGAVGADQIPAEVGEAIREADVEELRVLATRGVQTMQKVIALIMAKKS